MLVVTFMLGVFGRKILGWVLRNTIGVETIRTNLISVASYALMMVVTVAGFSAIYKYIPNKKLMFNKQIPGAVFVSLAWGIFTFVFSLYVEWFSGFTAYGTLGTIILFLLY